MTALTFSIDKIFRYIVLELCAASLEKCCLDDSHPKKYRGPMPSDVEVMLQIAKGLKYIHSRELVHRDIKPENILISLSQPIMMKLSDFGLCEEVKKTGIYSSSGVNGTIYWMAPELMLDLSKLTFTTTSDTGLTKYSYSSDIFSTGCVFFFFLTRGIHPFGNPHYVTANIFEDNPEEFLRSLILEFFSCFFFKLIWTWSVGSPLDPAATELIGQMINRDPVMRITLERVIQCLQNV